MSIITSAADKASPSRDMLRASYREELAKALQGGTAIRKQIKLQSVHISQAAQTANQTGTPPAADAGLINVALLKAAAQRRLGRPFG